MFGFGCNGGPLPGVQAGKGDSLGSMPQRSVSRRPQALTNFQYIYKNILSDILESSDSDDEEIDLEYIAQVRNLRLRRSSAAYPYEGELIMCINNIHPDNNKNWSSLPEHEQQRRWMTEFRMPEDAFLQLFQQVQPYLYCSTPKNTKQRTYTEKEKLLVTLIFLAHAPSLRQMASKWGMPHNSIAELCLHPTVFVLDWLFCESAQFKNIKWPSDEESEQRVMKGFRDECGVPGCVGAIDGSLIPQRKPTKEQANQDTDSYYGYKGGIASLLLAVCDIHMRFTYVNAGAPACVGDAGLFGTCQLGERIRDGLLQQRDITLYFEDGNVQKIFPYLVGDAAFPLSVNLMKAFDPPPFATETDKAEYNKRILLARRVIERAFWALKGRWVFCKRNVFWNNLKFTRAAIRACCGLHNYLVDLRNDMPEDIEPEDDDVDDKVNDLVPMPHLGADQETGQGVRETLVDWVVEH
jgi:hypothetical protein